MRKVRGEGAFTIVELTMVMIISTIMLSGLVTLVWGAMQSFNSSKDLQAVNDSSRRVLATMNRQIRTALHIDDSNTTNITFAFWADVDDDQGNTADIDTYTNAEWVGFYYDGATHKAMVQVTEPAGGGTTTGTLGSYVTSIDYYYFPAGVIPTGDPYAPTNGYVGTNFNEDIGMVRVVIRLQKNRVRRTFYQDVFLRVLNRTAD